MRITTFIEGSYYKISNKGVDSRNIFVSKEDYDRFETYLYILNDAESTRPANYFLRKHRGELSEHTRVEPLVGIGAYSLLPTQFEIILTPLSEKGASLFMQKISTAYTMYFNDKYQRSGRLFEGSFKTTILSDDVAIKSAFGQAHLSPAQLFLKDWESASISEVEAISQVLADYRYSSINEYISKKHVITTTNEFPRYIQRADTIDHFIRYWFDAQRKK